MSKTLQQKNTRYFLIWLPVVLLIGTGLFYILMSTHAHHMEEEQLELKQENIWNALLTNRESVASHITGEYDLLPGTPLHADLFNTLRDTSIYYPANKEWVAFKILTGQRLLKGQPYELTTYISSKEITHLIIKVFIADVFVFIMEAFLYHHEGSERIRYHQKSIPSTGGTNRHPRIRPTKPSADAAHR